MPNNAPKRGYFLGELLAGNWKAWVNTSSKDDEVGDGKRKGAHNSQSFAVGLDLCDLLDLGVDVLAVNTVLNLNAGHAAS